MRLARALPFAVGIAVVVAVGGYFYYGQQQQEQKTKRARAFVDQPAPVLAARATVSDVPVYLDAVGNTRALNTVTVRPQVGGQIVKVAFREGQDVKKGDTLAEIDPRTYQAQYDQSVAKKAQDEATLANARMDLERYTRLAASNSGSKQQADTQKALVAQLEAQVQGDQAAIDNTKTMLSYTKIISPIDGRVGLRMIDEGNLVQANDTNGIVVITQVRPIAVLFNLPQQQFAQVNRAYAKGPLEVDAMGPDGRTVVDKGSLQVIDNQMDQTTGTIRLKAEFPNANLQLWPGQFSNVRLLVETLKGAVTVPTSAIQRGPNGTFVYVVDSENKVSTKTVTIVQQDDTRAVISSGVQAQEQVVTTGFTRLSNGTRVAVQDADAQPTAVVPDAPPAGRRKRGDGGGGGERKDGEGRGGEGKDRRRTESTPATPSTKQ